MGGIQRDWGSELGREVPNHAHLTPSKQPKVLQAVSLCREGAERKQELRGKGSLHFYLLPVDLSFIKYEGIFFLSLVFHSYEIFHWFVSRFCKRYKVMESLSCFIKLLSWQNHCLAFLVQQGLLACRDRHPLFLLNTFCFPLS